MSGQTKFLLQESQMPKAWYNLQADLPKPLPAVLHPGTLQPIGPADLAPLFPMDLILQEVSTEREIEIPEPVREVFTLWHALGTAMVLVGAWIFAGRRKPKKAEVEAAEVEP